MAYPITKFWFYPLCAIALRKIRGIGNIPKTPFIIVSNHEHLADPLYILFPILRKLDKKVHFVATPAWWFLGDRICRGRSEEHTSELQSQFHLVCRLLLEKKKLIF